MNDPEPTAYPTDNHNYLVAWSSMPDQWSRDISSHPPSRVLPVFVGADDWNKYQKTGEYQSTPQFAGLGILYSWPEPDKWFYEAPEILDQYRTDVLRHLSAGLGYRTLAEFVIAGASWVRWECGCRPSQQVLSGALHVDPGDSQIRYEYLLDTWSLVERVPDIDLESALKSLISVFQGIDFEDLGHGQQQQPNVNTACYIFLAALLLLGERQRFETFAKMLIGDIMQAPTMSKRLLAAAAIAEPALDDLRIFTKSVDMN